MPISNDKNFLILPHRERKKFKKIPPAIGINIAIELYRNKNILEAFDCLEQIIDDYPNQSLQTLEVAQQLYENMNTQNRYELYQKREYNFPISSKDKVLDIGSGHLPFPLATHLADIAPHDDNYGRGGAHCKFIHNKSFTTCSLEKTPFRDKEFDFVYCSHVLEHSSNPIAACQELMRIGKRGYIETPTAGKDLFMNFAKISNHLWNIILVAGILIFIEYSEDEKKGISCDLIRNMADHPTTPRERGMAALMNIKARNFNTMFMWEEGFEFKIITNK